MYIQVYKLINRINNWDC